MASSEQPQTALKPMDEIALIAAIDDADNRSYGSNLSNLTAELSAQRALSIDLYLGKDVDPMLCKHRGELVEAATRYPEPWVSCGRIRCTSSKTLVLSFITIILSHRSLHRLFSCEGSRPEQMFVQGIRGLCNI